MGIAEAPEWLFPFLKAEFNSSRIEKSDMINYVFFCMTCKGHSFRGADKRDHPNHELIRVVKASHHFSVRVQDMNKKLCCDKISQYLFNSKWVYFLKSRANLQLLDESPNKKAKRSEQARVCTVCGWKLREGDSTSLYCSLACKFKWNDVNPKQDKDQIEEQAPVADPDRREIQGATTNGLEYAGMERGFSFRRRSRKGIPVRSPSQGCQMDFRGTVRF